MYRLEPIPAYVPDTSVVIEGLVSRLVKEGRIRGKILIHRAVISELENQANQGKATGFSGLEELKRLRELAEEGLIDIEIVGQRPSPSDIRYAHLGAIDALIRDYAYENGATLITADRVQALVAEATGVSVIYIPPRREEKLKIESMFDETTMSIHLKEGVPPRAKKGTPGEWLLVDLDSKPLNREEVESIAKEIIEVAKRRPDGFIEIDRRGSTIIQLGKYRIVITRPPLSEGWEITVVRPVKKLRLEDYKLPSKLMRRLEERAEGILIAGAPGMGKTTFAQALAEYYASKGKIVKTIESPRDMVLPPTITQYSKTYADVGELHDILLLSRPDYTVFDELRTDEDFKLYIDLRLAGIGMIGVVHATSPIDAIQRFIRRVDIGMLPSIIDTVIFIHRGRVEKVYGLRMTVKLPTGLREADLARPVVEVRDVLTDELEYEIYTFGEQTVVVPVKQVATLGYEEKLKRIIERLIPGAEVEIRDNMVILNVPRIAAKTLMKKMKRLKKLEDKYGITIRVNMVG
ncbi:PINc/VapC family ATPase [Hyperthermus butylicus]|uniref:Conserved archaeal protein n=1 Tax=Hyperthermus butylicus (strain DSM 5456 / JCM 9403 / PLM1-5) TaxID=415426 RepID=A2BM97_HYPBU|nr:PINc/VapC family ATPase [Hyperthermus butylicus]ABM81108.1 conserved archaeal protein [Hyperthermus butylicus DSM 5456]